MSIYSKWLLVCTFMFFHQSAVGYSETNLLFQTVPYGDLSSLSTKDLDELLKQLETSYENTRVNVSRGDLTFLSADERMKWEHDNRVWKILKLRMDLFVNEKVRETIKSEKPDYEFSLDKLLGNPQVTETTTNNNAPE